MRVTSTMIVFCILVETTSPTSVLRADDFSKVQHFFFDLENSVKRFLARILKRLLLELGQGARRSPARPSARAGRALERGTEPR